MKTNLLFDFTVDKPNKTILVKRQFAAALPLVWKAWTTAEILDQWWAPKPWKAETKEMNFTEGGRWLYAMVSPEGEKHWSFADYVKITPQEHFIARDGFCDENGVQNHDMPGARWENTFAEGEDGTTIVSIASIHNKLEDLEKILEMGFQEGFTAGLGNLDEYLAKQGGAGEKAAGSKAAVATYLNFPGNTEEAFLFYKAAFRTEFVGTGIMRMGDAPADPNQPPMADNVKNMVMHVALPITAGHLLMGTDAPKEMGFTVTPGNNMYISLSTETKEETDRLFAELSAGGKVEMELQDMFWGDYFGSFTDKFGINWMVSYTK